jgi:5,10-methylenetetrahydrofolate reductase
MIRAKMNEIKTKQTIQRINEAKSWLFEKINTVNRPLANMTNWRREKTQIIKIKDEKGNITTNMKSRESLESTLKTYI